MSLPHDPRHVAAVQHAWHEISCRSHYANDPRWAQAHHDWDAKKAVDVLDGLAQQGYHLTEGEPT